MSLASGIDHLFPEKRVFWECRNDGNGDYVSRWNELELGPMPSIDILRKAGEQAEAKLAVKKAQRKAVLKQIDAILAKTDDEIADEELKILILTMARKLYGPRK